MPTPAAAKPQCQLCSGFKPKAERSFFQASPCASQPVTSGESKAPRLMPM